tara:strand:- start:417 stop:638 length:222 start_codon:yes stop_codon:yes gene_type:complete
VNPAIKDIFEKPSESSSTNIKLFKKPAGQQRKIPIKKVFIIRLVGSGNLSDLTIYITMAIGTPIVKNKVRYII